jgi:hypothetical protein
MPKRRLIKIAGERNAAGVQVLRHGEVLELANLDADAVKP